MKCSDLHTVLDKLRSCETTDAGVRITTDCLYPSFEQVDVYIVRFGGGYRVHDNGGAGRSAWDHARDLQINKFLTREAQRFHLLVIDDSLVADVPSEEWLPSAILSVANASAMAANSAVERAASATETDLRDQIRAVLSQTVPEKDIASEYEAVGKSGKMHKFDFGVKIAGDDLLLLAAVSPHRISIASKYVAFADTMGGEYRAHNFAVHDRPLDSSDRSLLTQVADIVPLRSLGSGIQRVRAA